MSRPPRGPSAARERGGLQVALLSDAEVTRSRRSTTEDNVRTRLLTSFATALMVSRVALASPPEVTETNPDLGSSSANGHDDAPTAADEPVAPAECSGDTPCETADSVRPSPGKCNGSCAPHCYHSCAADCDDASALDCDHPCSSDGDASSASDCCEPCEGDGESNECDEEEPSDEDGCGEDGCGDPSEDDDEDDSGDSEDEWELYESAVRINIGALLRTNAHVDEPGLFAALDFGWGLAGLRVHGAWHDVGGERSIRQYGADLWLDPTNDTAFHPVLGFGMGWANVELRDEAGATTSTGRVGVGTLRGAFHYQLPGEHVDIRLGVEVVGTAPFVRPNELKDLSPWMTAGTSFVMGF